MLHQFKYLSDDHFTHHQLIALVGTLLALIGVNYYNYCVVFTLFCLHLKYAAKISLVKFFVGELQLHSIIICSYNKVSNFI